MIRISHIHTEIKDRMKIAIITMNKDGKYLAKKLKRRFPNAKIFNGRMDHRGSLRDLVHSIFNKYEGLIFISALGITVRLIGGLIKSKLTDPAVVSVDSAGRFSISVLSGHEGGANRLAFLVAESLDAFPVITTGKEVHKRFILGLGMRRGIDSDSVREAINKAIKKIGIGLDELRVVSTIDIKKNEEGLRQVCDELGLPLVFISKESIKNFKGNISNSEIVRRHIDLDGVCEPCALLAGRRATLILKKDVSKGIAIAIAREA